MRAVMLVVALAVVALVAACGGDDEGKTVTLGDKTFNDHGTKDVKGKAEVEFEADSFYFGPTFLRGEPGQKVKLKIENESSTQHNLTVAGQGVDQELAPKAKLEVEVTFPQSGAVRFFCKYHAGQGMNGELLAGNATPQAAQ